jgi:hypothetical protein
VRTAEFTEAGVAQTASAVQYLVLLAIYADLL